MICPRCKGRGKMDLNVHEGDTVQVVKITCVTCDGDGEINQVQYMIYRQEIEMWCRCGNPSGDVDYYEDGQRQDVQMHHIRCKDCGKVVQVG